MNWQTYIHSNPQILLGKPVVRRMRLSVEFILGLFAEGWTEAQRELQNTFFTKLVPDDNWFREQQRIMKMGDKIIKVELATGKQGVNTGLL